MREADKDGGRNLTNLRYADDTALIADNVTSINIILNRLDITGRNASLKLNAKKTKVMYIITLQKTSNWTTQILNRYKVSNILAQ